METMRLFFATRSGRQLESILEAPSSPIGRSRQGRVVDALVIEMGIAGVDEAKQLELVKVLLTAFPVFAGSFTSSRVKIVRQQGCFSPAVWKLLNPCSHGNLSISCRSCHGCESTESVL